MQESKIIWSDKKFKSPNKTIKIATMFSGIGAIEFAFRRLKLKTEIIFASDNDKFVKESYYANYNIHDNSWYDDVKDINGKKYKNQIDLLVGGSPCQSFSLVGKRKGLMMHEEHFFMNLQELLKSVNPKFLFLKTLKD